MKIYLDLAFLEDFFLANDDSDRHSRLKRLLCSAESPAQLIVNFDFEEIYKDPEKRILFRQIVNKLPTSDLEIIDKANTVSFHETKEPNLFFMNAESLKTERFGCFRMTSNQLEKGDLLLYPEKYSVDNTRKNWSFLSFCQLPCNSLILTDNYLNSSEETYENIFSILTTLMPLNLEITFDLTIIGDKNNFKSIKEQYDQIIIKLKNVFSYEINLTIIRENHHMRSIQTNYTRIWSDQGFVLFKNNRIINGKETTAEFSSVGEFGRETSTYKTRNNELEKCKKIIRVERMPDKVIGSRKNRLIQ